ncbi:actino_creatin, creatinine amidohydrolase family protein, mycofactocin system [Rhabdaerophilaceae bacterium]
MLISAMNWMQVEAQAKRDDRAVLPIGSIEQHAYLSLAVDAILAGKMAEDAAEPEGLPVFPTLNYGLTPNFVAYPGTISLKLSTLIAVLGDVLDGIRRSGFKRILIVNGHGGNSPAHGAALEWLDRNPGCELRWHNWWNAPKTWAKVMETDPVASHASWMENFPWTRLPGVEQPVHQKAMLDMDMFVPLDPVRKRAMLGDGNYGGVYQRPDAEMHAIWNIAVAETRALLADGWAR